MRRPELQSPVRHSLAMYVFPTREEMGKAAAKDVAQAMARVIKKKWNVNVAFAAAPSQNEFLAYLSRIRSIDWSRVTCFHLDEYIDLPRHHPNTFEVYLREHLFDWVHPRRTYLLKALEGTPSQIARRYEEHIKKSGSLDIVCLGIGENGHIAFCEPGTDLQDPQKIRKIRLDDRSVKQQYRDYRNHPNPRARYLSLEAVPRRALTMTIPTILSSNEIYVIVPGLQKAEAVKKMWEGPISSACPASALRMHRCVRIYLDRDSAGGLPPK